ncbi:nitroreductase family protein [Neotabrizicola sp. VNH66]|uniref:nitroreductase family protein n=1 Tax=Neotabrizicola sp. VNH66 TaxID=3400918 RepID=UPI003C0157E2
MPEKNPAALDFLAARLSQPAKLFTLPVPDRAALEPILIAALRVPDHGKLEPWRLIVLGAEDFPRLADLAEARAKELGADAEQTEKGRGQFDRGLLAVAVISSPKPSGKIPLAEQVLSAGALCLNLVTVATAAGWGANWLSGWPAHDPVFRARAFGCTEAETVAGIVHIGTPRSPAPDRPRPVLEHVVQWGLR